MMEPVAIVGMACRFPGRATDPERFWELLREGVDTITEVPRERWDLQRLYDPDPEAVGKVYTRWGGFLEDADRFDGSFFGISPREAAQMDPQQRLLLTVAWEAIEHGGQPLERLSERSTGVFVGASHYDWFSMSAGLPVGAHTATGGLASFLAGRLSYLLDLRGPALTLDTSCSSSLVALHLACQSLRSAECDVALAGGVNLLLSPLLTIAACRLRALAPDGRCRTFDAQASGFIRSEGCGVVVLKRVSDALRDGDRILALVRGSAVNQDGRSAGLTAPNPVAQAALIRRALASAGVSASAIGYVEAHGTGTPLGDPIEVEALAEVLGRPRADGGVCVLGSVKTNIGHLEAAAGIAGLMKTVLALRHEAIPPHLHFKALNPYVALEGTCLELPLQLRPWPRGERPRLAGVSAFGMSGTNCHVVLEEAPPERVPERPVQAARLLVLSARGEEALAAQARAYRELLASGAVGVAELCAAAALRRSHHSHRLAIVAGDRGELIQHLDAFLRGEQPAALLKGRTPALRPARPPAPPGEQVAPEELGQLYVAGHPIDWQVHYPGPTSWVELPRYPWQWARLGLQPALGEGERAAAEVREPPAPPAPKEPARQPASLEAYLLELTARVLDVPVQRLDPHQPLQALGLDSIMAIEMQGQIEVDLKLAVALDKILASEGVASLTAELSRLAPSAVAAPAPAPERASEEHALSFSQRALWFLYELNPESSAYNMSCALRLLTPTRQQSVRRAFQALVDRHPSLRTTYGSRQGQPFQRVHGHLPLSLEAHEASGWSEQELQLHLGDAAHRPFHLEREAPFRLAWFEGQGSGPVLLVTAHHISMDFWSFIILMDEFRLLHAAGEGEARPRLPVPARQYPDFVVWEAEASGGPEGEEALRYWQRKLAGAPPLLSLPADRPRSQVSGRGAKYFQQLDGEVVHQVRALAASEGVTPFVALLAGFYALLYHCTGQEDIVVGSAATRRAEGAFRDVVGYLTSPLALRVDMSDAPSISELLERVSATVLEAVRHLSCPFPLLVERLQPTRKAGEAPFFNVMFVLDRSHRREVQGLAHLVAGWPGFRMDLGGLEVESLAVERRSAQFDMTLLVFETDQALSCSWEYDAELFSAATIQRLAELYQALLKVMAADPSESLSGAAAALS